MSLVKFLLSLRRDKALTLTLNNSPRPFISFRKGPTRPREALKSSKRKSLEFWILAVFLGIVLLMGGSARGDVPSLILLRPLAALVAGFGALRLRWTAMSQFRPIVYIVIAITALPLLHLVPLPAPVWHSLAGRELIRGIDAVALGKDLARPLSISPVETWNAFFSLLVPLAVFLLGLCLSYRERRALLGVLLVCGVITLTIAILQLASMAGQSLYLYTVTNDGGAVGVFANRNHQAVFLAMLYPMLTVFCTSETGWGRIGSLLCIGIGLVLVPLVIVTGSRAGLIILAIGIASIFSLIDRNVVSFLTRGRSMARWALPVALVGSAIVSISILPRAEAVHRLLATGDKTLESRPDIWRSAWAGGKHFGLLGSGVGTFVPAYKIYEPSRLLAPEYLNHAHNDFLETVLTGGVPALVILLVVIVFWARSAWRWLSARPDSDEIRYGRLGAVVIFMLGVASVVDYPLRVPFMSSVFVCAVLWMLGRPDRPNEPSAVGSMGC